MLPDYLNYKTNAKSPRTVNFGNCRFTVITSRLIRIEQGEFTDNATLSVICRDFDAPQFTSVVGNGILVIETEHLLLKYTVGEELNCNTLNIEFLNDFEKVWHYGEKPLTNLGGTVTTLDMINGACEIGDGICSADGFAIIDDSKTPLFDSEGWFLKRKENTVDIYFFGYGHDYTSCIKDYYRLTGIPEMLPSFAFGNWWSRYYKYTEESYLSLMDKFKEKDIPISVGIVDMDWHLTDGDGRDYRTDGWTGYTWNKEFFPDYKRFIKRLHSKGIKTALNLHPQSGLRHWEEQYEKVAIRLGLNSKSKEPIPFNYVDTKIWEVYFEELIFPYEENGVDFWWIDWQEQFDYYKPVGQKLECMSPLWMLNHFHYLVSKRNGNRGMIFSRFAGYGSQRYPIGFSGDTIITWETLDFQPYFTVTASNIGYSFWSHDIGGHMQGYRDDELTTRWIQFGVFSPIFRLHSTDNIFTGREPWGYNKQAELIITDFMRLRHQLFPYIYTMCYRNCSELLPLMRPLYHTDPECKEAYEFKNEYWYGSELIVAPITKKSDNITLLSSTEVWLPSGNWIDWFTGEVYKGNTKYTVYRPLEQIPVFCKTGAIIPMQEHTKFDNHLGSSENLEIVVCAGENGSFIMYEDDGKTESYKHGNYCKTEFTFDWLGTKAIFAKKESKGELFLIPIKRKYTIIFKGFKKGCRFFNNQREIKANYNEELNSYRLEPIICNSDSSFDVTISCNYAMLYDNSGALNHIVTILSHAQCSFAEKDKWLSMAKDIIEKSNSGYMDKLINETDNIAQAILEQLRLFGIE